MKYLSYIVCSVVFVCLSLYYEDFCAHRNEKSAPPLTEYVINVVSQLACVHMYICRHSRPQCMNTSSMW